MAWRAWLHVTIGACIHTISFVSHLCANATVAALLAVNEYISLFGAASRIDSCCEAENSTFDYTGSLLEPSCSLGRFSFMHHTLWCSWKGCAVGKWTGPGESEQCRSEPSYSRIH